MYANSASTSFGLSIWPKYHYSKFYYAFQFGIREFFILATSGLFKLIDIPKLLHQNYFTKIILVSKWTMY